MGRFAAIGLAQLGAQILVVGHNQARGAAAAEAIRNAGGSVQFLRADLGDAAEVCALAAAVLTRSGPVHVLIHSAGGLLPAGARTREGVDRGFAQNFLGAFLLTRLLVECILASAPARVIAVGSGAHRLVKSADIDALMHPSTTAAHMGSRQRAATKCAATRPPSSRSLPRHTASPAAGQAGASPPTCSTPASSKARADQSISRARRRCAS
jgi:NAD(P)-dependent dehydrogenase (short-subunit alcohol dehydrogenase family)